MGAPLRSLATSAPPAPAPRPTSPAHPVTLHDKYEREAERALLSGIDALVRLVLEQRWLDQSRGLTTGAFVSGYEGSPLGGLDLELRRARADLAAVGAVFEPGLNEELAATAVAGTQLVSTLPGHRVDGVAGFWFGKNPGFDRAADAIRHGNISGTAPLGGAVAVVGDDPGCKSSTLPSACEELARSLGLPLLAPSSVGEVLELGLHAVALSRFAGVWTALKVVADVADGSAVLTLPPRRHDIPDADTGRTFHPHPLVGPAAVEAEQHLRTLRLPRVARYAAATGLNAVRHDVARPRIAVVASGHCYAALARAMADLGLGDAERDALGLRVIELRLLWPLDPSEVRRLVGDVETVLVVEDKTPFVEGQLTAALYGTVRPPRVLGRFDAAGRPLLPSWGSLDADAVSTALGRVLPRDRMPTHALRRLELLEVTQGLGRTMSRIGPAATPGTPGTPDTPGTPGTPVTAASDVPARTPYFCSGCPHNRSTRAADGELVGLGIGCHIMASFDEGGRGQQTGTTQMGGEGAQWIGMAPFTDDAHFTQNLGDGTFFHSGSLAVRASVAAGVDVTYKLLYNDAVAMTGGQLPVGRMSVPELAQWLELEGVRRVVVVSPEPRAYRKVSLPRRTEVAHRDELASIEERLSHEPGVSVILYDDRCAAEERRLRSRGVLDEPERRVFINERVCEGCGDCGAKSTCLSVVPVETEYGTKTRIDQGSCNKDYSCLDGDCPSFVEVRPRRHPLRRPLGHWRRRRHAADAQPAASLLVEPPAVTSPAHDRLPDHLAIRMVGVGGTGVVTTSRIVEMAAHLEGLHTAALDQTGLSQKGGPVVSDLRIARAPVEGAARLGAASADLLLGFDLLDSAAPSNLRVVDPARTTAVLNAHVAPTAAMMHGEPAPPASQLVQRVAERTRAGEHLALDADAIARQLVGDPMSANLVLVGAACQQGSLPLPPEALEGAVRLNATAVERNLAALAWGRAAVADPRAVQQALAPTTPVTLGPSRAPRAAPDPATHALVDEHLGDLGLPAALLTLVAKRSEDLIDYQHRAYARRYTESLRHIADGERRATGDPQWPVTAAAARGLYKLMAYKDEYEVARLHLLATERRRLEAEFGADGRTLRTRVMLHPPLLRAMGLRHKIGLGRSARPAFRMLRAGRRLRGTAFDPFGHTAMRRTERALVGEYLDLLDHALDHLTPDTAPDVVRLAALPDRVRGYEDVKWRSLEDYRREAAELLESLEETAVAGPHRPRPTLPLAG